MFMTNQNGFQPILNTKGTPLYVNASGNLEKRIQLGPTEIILRVKL